MMIGQRDAYIIIKKSRVTAAETPPRVWARQEQRQDASTYSHIVVRLMHTRNEKTLRFMLAKYPHTLIVITGH